MDKPNLTQQAGRSTAEARIKKLLLADDQPATSLGVHAQLSRGILAAAMDQLRLPFILVDRHLAVLHANRAAKTALASGCVLSERDGHLVISSSQAAALSNAIEAASRGCPIPRTMILNGASGTPLIVWLRPIDASLQTTSLAWANGIVSLTFRPLRARPTISMLALKTHFDLTTKQAEVLAILACGFSINEVADQLGIKRATACSHLAQCFVKTGTHRQPDLISLVQSLESPILEL